MSSFYSTQEERWSTESCCRDITIYNTLIPSFLGAAVMVSSMVSSKKMTTVVKNESDTMIRCASCGAGGNDIKLKRCTACYLIRYCSVKCQMEHRPKHKKECKKRAAELNDEILFKQPESSHYGECPICCLPLSLDPSKSASLNSCCSKTICIGCSLANKKREVEGNLQHKCAFCRKALPNTMEEFYEQLMKRIEVNDPVAIRYMGTKRYDEGDCKAAFEYWKSAAALGDAEAHYQLSYLYMKGQGVEKDEKRAMHHAEQAAIVGQPNARHNIGWIEQKRGRMDRAVKHWIIAAKLGNDDSLDALKKAYKARLMSKDDFAAALRGHQAAVDATKSPQRDEAAKFFTNLKEELSDYLPADSADWLPRS